MCLVYYLFVYYFIGNRSFTFATVPEGIEASLKLQLNYVLAASSKFLSLSLYWTLTVEEYFYLFIPIPLLLLQTNKNRLIFCLFSLAFIEM